MPKRKKSSRVPGDAYGTHLHARVWLRGAGDTYLGVGKVRLLEWIGECGSISEAAKRMSLSYKRAWEMVEELNHLTGVALVEKSVGGIGGGSAHLTAAGSDVIARYRRLEAALRGFASAVEPEVALVPAQALGALHTEVDGATVPEPPGSGRDD